MNPVALAVDLLLASLLVLALIVGVRLNRRLQALRESQAGFAKAVAELNQAAARAEAGLSALRATSEEVHDSLLARIETARALSLKLERASLLAERTNPPPPSPEPAALNSLAAIAAMMKTVSHEVSPSSAPVVETAAPRATSASSAASSPQDARPPASASTRRTRPSPDDDLFDDGVAERARRPGPLPRPKGDLR